MFVLDRASEAVLVFKPKPDGSLTQTASLPVGSRPSALVRASFNGDADELIDRQDLMIGANPAALNEPWTLPSG